MDLDALRSADFSKLATAVGDWTAMAKKLWELEHDARGDLGGKAAKAGWAGVNATVTREFITKTAKEFADAATEATSIANILRDTHGELVEYKARLDEAVRRGLEKNLTVVGTGGCGFTVTMSVHPDRAAGGGTTPEHTEAEAIALRDEVQRILEGATESDPSPPPSARAACSTSGRTWPTRPTAARCSARATTSSATSNATSPSCWPAPPSPTARPCAPGRTTWSSWVRSASRPGAASSTATS
ncbi:hypothetical protein [Streptomyces sp. NPDC058157]|uniref:hypothetical protein n=1 Tax=Streptomyces sp. NPDC058157 TaxID=3346360 RepID=UPI0036EAF943